MLFNVLCLLFFLGNGLHKMSWTGRHVQQRVTCQNSDPFCHEQILPHTTPILYRSISYHDHIIAAAPHKKKKSNKPSQVHFTIPQNIDLHIHLRLHPSLTYNHTNHHHLPHLHTKFANHHHQRISLIIRQASILVDICFGLVFCGTLTSTYIATTDWEKAPKDFRQPLVVEQMGGWVVGVVLGRGVWFPNRG